MKTKTIAVSAIIAALYAVITLMLGEIGYGVFQFRPAEALTLLPFIYPPAMLGLFVGCAIANILGYGVIDMIFGSLATLLAAYLTSRCKSLWMAAVPPIVINAVVVGAIIVAGTPDMTFAAWPVNAGAIAISQTLSVGVLGVPLVLALKKLRVQEMLNA